MNKKKVTKILLVLSVVIIILGIILGIVISNDFVNSIPKDNIFFESSFLSRLVEFGGNIGTKIIKTAIIILSIVVDIIIWIIYGIILLIIELVKSKKEEEQ